MAYYPYAQTLSDIYTLTSPDGGVAVFNDVTDPNYVGVLSEVTGLDSADVRESAEDLTQADGGSHGYFYYGRRPITMTGTVYGHATVAARTAKLDRLHRASHAMRGDAVLKWKPATWQTESYIEMFTWVRRQQPLRYSGGWVKQFQLSLVSEYAFLYSMSLRTATAASGTAVTVENQGSGPASPIFRITNASANPTITNSTPEPDQVLRTTGLTLATGETIEIDTLTHTAKFTAGARSGQSANRYIDFGGTPYWPTLQSGNNSILLAGGGSLTVEWRDTWL